MKTLFISLMMFTLVWAQAKDRDEDVNGETFLQRQMQQGRLVTITLTLGNPVKIFITGKEEARLNLNNLKLKIRRLDPYPGEELRFNKMGNLYTVAIPETGKDLKLLEVTATVKDESESFQFRLDNKKP